MRHVCILNYTNIYMYHKLPNTGCIYIVKMSVHPVYTMHDTPAITMSETIIKYQGSNITELLEGFGNYRKLCTSQPP